MKTETDIRALIGWLREPVVSTRVNCRTPDHRAPFDFVRDVLLGRSLDFLVWANRSGSKSYLAGLITWALSSFTPRLETTILGGSFDQSEKVYKAMGGLWDMTGLQDEYLEAEPTRRLTLWRSGSKVSVLTASTRSARGPHPQRLLLDEIDEMAEEVYTAALSQPQSKHGLPSSTGQLSTNHHYGGVMDKAVEAARAAGTPFYKWCVWECLKSCRDYRCSTCPLTPYCPGPQMRQADGYYEPADFIKKLYTLSATVLQVEWFCEKRGRTDLIYGEEYDEVLHSPADLPDFNEGLPVYVSIDWGGVKPFSVGFWQRWPFGWVRFDEYYRSGTTLPRVLYDIEKKLPWSRYWLNIRGGVGDPGRVDLLKECADHEPPLYIKPAKNEVAEGIEAVRNALRPVLGAPKIFIHRRCKAWRSEVYDYRERGGKPVKEKDHAMDETRYFAMEYVVEKKVRRGRVFHRGAGAPAAKPGDGDGKPARGMVEAIAGLAGQAVAPVQVPPRPVLPPVPVVPSRPAYVRAAPEEEPEDREVPARLSLLAKKVASAVPTKPAYEKEVNALLEKKAATLDGDGRPKTQGGYNGPRRGKVYWSR